MIQASLFQQFKLSIGNIAPETIGDEQYCIWLVYFRILEYYKQVLLFQSKHVLVWFIDNMGFEFKFSTE